MMKSSKRRVVGLFVMASASVLVGACSSASPEELAGQQEDQMPAVVTPPIRTQVRTTPPAEPHCVLRHPSSWWVASGVSCIETTFPGLPSVEYLLPNEYPATLLISEGDHPNYPNEGSSFAHCVIGDDGRPKLRFFGQTCKRKPRPFPQPEPPPGHGPEEP